jgi:putative ABC transport system permease protein
MFKNYFKIAWRSLWKSRFYTLINISGLAVGLATSIMLLLWVQNELSYDKFHKDYKNIYQVSSHFGSNGEGQTWTGVPGPLAVYAKSIPTVQSLVRINTEHDQILSDKDKKKMFDGNVVAFVDSSFFTMFSFPLLKGNIATVFPDSNSVVLTQSTAQKLFGNENPMGKTVGFYKNYFIVTGVLQ